METKPLLYGLIGFILGGLIVSVAATTVNKSDASTVTDVSMVQMADSLKGKRGEDFDKAFITGMIEHHQGAIDMAKLAEKNAKHDEVKDLSKEIVSAQEAEITKMKRWQVEWGYTDSELMQSEHKRH